MKPRVFRIHFNRLNMQRGNPNVWTVHLSDRCIQCREVTCRVPLITRYSPDGRQPRAFLYGKGRVKTLLRGFSGRVVVEID